MTDFYYNEKGQKVIISEMPDAYLLNSYAKRKARKKKIEDSTPISQMGSVMEHLAKLDGEIEAMKAEIVKRELI